MLRGCDAEPYLRLKEKIESRPTDSNAVYQDGKVRPVFIYTLNGTDVFVVEGDDYKFYPAQQVPGFVRWEAKPNLQPAVVEPPPQPEQPKIQGRTWAEQKASAAEIARKARAEQRAAHQSQNAMPAGDPALTKAGYELAQAVARSKGQRN